MTKVISCNCSFTEHMKYISRELYFVIKRKDLKMPNSIGLDLKVSAHTDIFERIQRAERTRKPAHTKNKIRKDKTHRDIVKTLVFLCIAQRLLTCIWKSNF